MLKGLKPSEEGAVEEVGGKLEQALFEIRR